MATSLITIFFTQKNASLLLIGISTLLAHAYLSYAVIRTDVHQVFGIFALLFAAYYLLYRNIQTPKQYYYGITLAIAARLILLFSFPNLSDDIYRFIWDGSVLGAGISPFAYTPSHFFDGTYLGMPIASLSPHLYNQLNSPDYFTIYPPVCQFIFYLGNYFFPNSLLGSAIIVKLFLFFCECLSIFLLHRLVKVWQISQKKVLLYALNPLVIAELVGNIHFEAAMITGILLAIYGLQVQKNNLSALGMTFAICSKLLPLLLLPFLVRRLSWQQLSVYFLIIASLTTIGFIPLIDIDSLQHLTSSIGLYFGRFEFNASLYYLLRKVGYIITGHNYIILIAPFLALTVLCSILWMAYREKDLSTRHLVHQSFFALALYLALATTVHPWYITSLVALSPFMPYRFALVWSAATVLSYYAYLSASYTENLYLVAFSYLIVYGYFLYEYSSYQHKCQAPI
jgi:alpha-1,6-mannosyltransferase